MRARFLWERRIAICCAAALALGWLAGVLWACAPEFAWESRLGVRMYAGEFEDYVTPDQVDEMESAAIDDLEAYGFARDGLLEAARHQAITISEGPIWSDGRAGMVLANGLKVRAVPCLWQSALRHEMTHHLEGWFDSFYDYSHRRPYWMAADAPMHECE